jgi:hypothetical protein
MLGKHLRLRVEQLARQTDTIDGRRLLSVGAHIATKWAATLDRRCSERGDKDRAELLKLLKEPGAAAAADVLREASSLTPVARRRGNPVSGHEIISAPDWFGR